MTISHPLMHTGVFIIYVDSYRNAIPTGSIYHPATEESEPFDSLMQMLLKLEQFLNSENAPQAFNQIRSFSVPELPLFSETPLPLPRNGQLATFSLQIMYRRGASWQGSSSWLEGKQTQCFRSVLELLHLIHGSLNSRSLLLFQPHSSQLGYAK